ncbi:MAG: Ribosomal small subunit Rsm22 [Myxococcales bacterium]|nr:Ribosomal small subunit Rsm22 [Myxococcales bacterium]
MYAAARAAIGEAPLATSPLLKAIVDRSERYTSDRDRLSTPANKTGDLAARAVFFTIADAMKISIPLGELIGRGALPSARPLRVIDLGAGCGAMSLGMIETIASLPEPERPALVITAIDRDAAALGIAAAAVRGLAATRKLDVTITTRVDDATSAKLADADLVIAGTLLNELPAAARLAVVERALAAVGDDGAVILIEPALRETSRALHELRDEAIGRGAHVFAPCVRAIAPCPSLARPEDWCHEDRAIKLPPKTAELSRLTHLRDGGMKFSYLVLRRGPLALVEEPGAWRIVGAPRTQKGKLEVMGCNDAGWVPLRLLKRNRTDANREIERADRGDVVIVPAPVDGERVEVTADTPVERREPSKLR